MMRRFVSFPWMGLPFLALLLVFCGPQKGGNGDPCQVDEDCLAELECRATRCRTKLEDNPPRALSRISPNTPKVGQKVTLDGTPSNDDRTPLAQLTFAWTLKETPSKSKAQLENADKKIASFVPDKPGDYKIQLVVSDGKNKSSPHLTTVTVEALPNDKPIANAGEDQLVLPGDQVTLDGSKSTDPNSQDKLSYAWNLKLKPPDSNAKLNDPDSEKPSFTADKEGRYILELVVHDDRGLSSDPDSVIVLADPYGQYEPKIKKITPTHASTDSIVDLVIEGEEFAPGARVSLSGKHTYKTDYVDKTKLKAKVDLSAVAPDKYDLTVKNPNNKESPALPFTVDPIPVPRLSSLSPNRAATGSILKVKATGENFLPGGKTTAVFKVTKLPTTVQDSKNLAFDLDLRNTDPGIYKVRLTNPGGRTSKEELEFIVTAKQPAPVLKVLNPPYATEGEKVAFSVHGIGFQQGAKILFDGKEIPSKRIRRDEIDADPHLDLTKIKAGTYEVWVKNPDQEISNKLPFQVQPTDPEPKLDRILPFNLYLDEVHKNVAVYGAQFIKGCKLFIGKNEISGKFGAVTWKSASYLEAKVDLTDSNAWNAGNYDAYVENPNGKKSKPFKLTVTYRVPSISTISPSSWTTKCDTTITVEGMNFVPKATLYFGSTPYKTSSSTNKLTFVSDKELSFKLKATSLSPQTYKVYVSNGPSAESSKVDFKVDSSSSLTPYPKEVRPAIGQADTTVAVQIRPNSGGTNYYSIKPGAVVELSGKLQTSSCAYSYCSSTYGCYCSTLEAKLDLSGFKPGAYDLYVVNPCNVKSAAMTFTVEPPPTPAITSFSPSFAHPGDKFKIVFKGQNFTKNHKLIWNGTQIKSTFVSGKEIQTDGPVDFTGAKFGYINFRIENGNGTKTPDIRFSIIPSFTPTITEVIPNSFQRGRVLKNILLKGANFLLTSTIYFDGKPMPTSFTSASEISISTLDAQNIKAGLYFVRVKNGSRTSNYFPILLNPIPPPRLTSLSPSNAAAGSNFTSTVYVRGQRFPVPPNLVITNEKGKDLSSRWKTTTSYPSTTYFYGKFDISGLAAGKYGFQVKNPTGELSNKLYFTLTPPPAPVALSLSPNFVYRGNPTQTVVISGSNFVNGDVVIFNNNMLNRIPGTVPTGSSGSLTATIDISKIRRSGQYDIFVMRCLNAACDKNQKTQTLKLTIQDPPCSLINCKSAMAPAGSEDCDSASKVCRPTCTSDATCKTLDPKGPWTCKSGFCK